MQKKYIKDIPQLLGKSVEAAGWVHARRDMGKIVFIDLRDSTGLLQVVFAPNDRDLLAKAMGLRPEYCVRIRGTVNERPERMRNPNLATGGVELLADELEVLNEAKTPPFEIDRDTTAVNEELRLKYRYLDLRSERLARNVRLRDRVVGFFRDFLRSEGFIEVETPTLTKGTPEGAREFVVPSRIHPGKFYVLPQSPQQFKQLLMVAGVERYFQVARCFRDEDQRGDRQPEFTQLDLEMSFVGQEDVLELNERMMVELVRSVCPEKRLTSLPFPRIPYSEAMDRYGTDKPDLRQDRNDPDELAFCWVVDFPLFERGDDGSVQAAHHPFCMPNPADLHLLDSDPFSVRALTYDLVLNGYELSSGSIRIHKPELQDRIFRLLGLDDETIRLRFGHLLEAFGYGAPPHGGMAPGIDRLVMLLAGEPNIREVIPFPKTGDARDPMTGAPSGLAPSLLKDVHIGIDA